MEYEEHQRFKVEFAKEISTPDYRKYCRENGLKFHFWDEYPEEEFDPTISGKEIRLHWKARILFNKTKDRYTVYKNQIIDYYFDEWVEPSFTEIMDIETLIFKYEELEKEYKEYKNISDLRLAIAFYVLFAWMFVLYLYFVKYTLNLHIIIDAIIFLFPLLIIFYLPNYIIKTKRRRKVRKLNNELHSEVEFIRSKLNENQK